MKIQFIKNCYQCRYGQQDARWCAEEGRAIEDMETIPDWCQLENENTYAKRLLANAETYRFLDKES